MRTKHNRSDWLGTNFFQLKKELDDIPSSRVFDTREALLDAALSLASVIARKSPVAVQGSKINLNYARDHSIDDSFNYIVSSSLELVRFFILVLF